MSLFTFQECHKTGLCLELPRVLNLDYSGRFAWLGANTLNLLDKRISLDDPAKHHVLAIKPRSRDSGDEELASIGAGTSVGHAQEEGHGVLFLEVLIGKLFSVDAFSSSSISFGEVSTLEHELGDDSVENGSLIVQGFALFTDTLLTCAESAEILSSLRDNISVELEYNPALSLSANTNIKKHKIWKKKTSSKIPAEHRHFLKYQGPLMKK